MTEAAIDAARARDPDRIDPLVWRIACVTVIGTIMSILDTTIVNVALETLHRELHSPLTNIQWVATGYLLSLATVIPLSGWASRRFGHKRIYIASLVVFTLGSALCGLAWSTSSLIVFRVLQGFGGGMIMPVGQMILVGVAGRRRLARVVSITSVPTMLGPTLGPTIGGLILQSGSWRWIFYVNLPIGIIALTLAIRILPNFQDREGLRPLDVAGLFMIGLAMPLLTYGLTEIGVTGGFSSIKVLVPVLGGLALFVAFVAHGLRVPAPLLDLRLFRKRTYAAASLLNFFVGATVFGTTILLPLYFQQLRGASTLDTGLLLGPTGLGLAMTMPIVGRLTDRFGGGPLVIFGVIVMTASGVAFAFINQHTSLALICVLQYVRGIGMGSAFMPAFVAVFTSLERHEVAHATPQISVLMRLGSSIGAAVLTVVLSRALLDHAHTPTGVAHSFDISFWWAMALGATSIVPAIWLLRAERAAVRLRGGRRHRDDDDDDRHEMFIEVAA